MFLQDWTCGALFPLRSFLFVSNGWLDQHNLMCHVYSREPRECLLSKVAFVQSSQSWTSLRTQNGLIIFAD